MLNINKNISFKIILICFMSLISMIVFSQNQDSVKINYTIKEQLYVPFGTLVKLKIKIVDGNELQLKALAGSYLIKIIEVDSIILENPIIMTFKDETSKFPTDNFELYKMLYGKETGSLSSATINKMNKQYVGKEFYVVAYETGQFVGLPNMGEYVKKNIPSYAKLIRQDCSFSFKNYIIIESKITDIE